MDDYKQLIFACLAAGIATYAVRWYTDPLRAIPTVGGSSLPGLSWLAALRMLRNCRAVLEEGYGKYPEQTFKLPALDRWMVVVSGRELVEELRKRGDDELSQPEGAQETLQFKYLFEPSVFRDEYHVDVVKGRFTRRLPAMLPDVVDEVKAAVKDHIVTRLGDDEWTSVEVMPVMQNIIARVSSRVFVGLPLCRNEEYLRVAVDFTVDVMKTCVGGIHRRAYRIVARFYNMVKRDTERAVAFLRPIIEERQRGGVELDEDGKPHRQNDLLQFILDKATPKHEPVFTIVQRLMTVNFAAIHTSSNTITHALTRLAEQPELLTPLRDEIEGSIAADGWTPAALANMQKLDSLLRETLRFHGIGLLSMVRKAMKDLTLRDGTRIPRGTLVEVAAYPMHHDSALLERADAFDAFRYARKHMPAGEGARLLFTATSPEYVPFGHGRHACPGRYFASSQLKAILAHVILSYDIKLGGDGVRATDVFVAMGVLPAPQSRVLFRARKRGGDPGQ
ncbi:cytochrome P450 [Ganoderma sinense ZZ0214-1]|uniref:Cytochrome P450 n=1 Tax=Ganoderma sinense ZZ0214-1 TaxID=1077348 RepID=A0A2G8S2G8_9APHY|nr:cytochrome P450 [Ganoderma sinense ZZ0214-1]